jgi:hypothetical protein
VRDRVVRYTTVVALVAILIVGVPLIVIARQQVWSDAGSRLQHQANTLAAAFAPRLGSDKLVDSSGIAGRLPGQRVVITQSDGRHIIAGPDIGAKVLVRSARVGGATVTVEEKKSPTVSKGRKAMVFVFGLMVLALLVGFGLARWYTRRIGLVNARPAAPPAPSVTEMSGEHA